LNLAIFKSKEEYYSIVDGYLNYNIIRETAMLLDVRYHFEVSGATMSVAVNTKCFILLKIVH